jgi:ATP-dependent Lon protease
LNTSYELPTDELRWRVDESALSFKSTAEVDPAEGIIGQPIALEAMRFGVESHAPGQNIYVRGTSGTGRMTLVQSILQELNPKARRRLDRCYVHNFHQPDHPRLITLTAGQGPVLRSRMKELADFIENQLIDSLEGEPLKSRKEAISKQTQQLLKELTQPLEDELRTNGLTMVRLQSGPVTRTAIFPLIEDKPIPPEEFSEMLQSGTVSEEEFKRLQAGIAEFNVQMQEVSREASKVLQKSQNDIQALSANEARAILQDFTAGLISEMPQPEVVEFVDEVIGDAVDNRLSPAALESQAPPQIVYGVNVICSHESEGSPVITENTPSVSNLLGTVEPEVVAGGQTMTNYRGIRAGALVHADGGYLILDAHDVLSEPGSWRMLMRVLRTGSVEIVPPELGWPITSQSLKPQPIEISARIILIGSSSLYYQLDQVDQDFTNLFKVLVDFASEIERSELGVNQYAGVVARMCRDENLLNFSVGGVAALAEHGARVASRKGKITARFGRIADIVREAAFLAQKASDETVERKHVEHTVQRTKYRASLPSSRFQELISDGTIMMQTTGAVIGQINGLAVINAGPLSYGFPARITATIGAGRAGIINIEGAASMSGTIHTKGFQILGGLLRHLIRTDHPLAFSASIAFEQSYGGIDGDSASGAEICCLLSALTGVPIHQGVAMTGAIDQHGHIQAIGGVNEKIEGFFDACKSQRLAVGQGVIIPMANAGDLMLRQDVIDACEESRFQVHAVSNVCQALEILTGRIAGEANEKGEYPEDSLLHLARCRATEFWSKTFSHPSRP